jgi:hypothetical protein
MPDFFNVDPNLSAYFTPQAEGEGFQSAGAGDGSDWIDWERSLPQDQYSNFLSSEQAGDAFRGQRMSADYSFNRGAFDKWLTGNNYSLKEQNNNGFWTRGVFDPSGKVVGKTEQGSYNDPEFALASAMLGGAGGSFLGGLNGLGAIGSGAMAGFASTGMGNPELSSMTKGALTGAVGAGLAPDVAKYAGLGDGMLGQAVNGAVKSGITAAIGGGDIGKSALQGGVYSGLNSLGSGGGQVDNAFGQDYSRAPWASSSPSFSTPSDAGGMSYSPWSGSTGGNPQQDDWGSGALGEFATSLLGAGRSAMDAVGGPKGLGDLASGLMGAYSGYKRQRMAKDYLSQMGANRNSYAEQIRKNLMAKDAARGRRSNIGGREVELQARLADLDSRNAPAYNQLSEARMGGLEQILASGLRYGNKQGWFTNPTAPNIGDGGMMSMPNPGAGINFPMSYEPSPSLDSMFQMSRRPRTTGVY